MKSIIVATVLALCLVGISAGPAPMPVALNAQVMSVVEEMGHIAEDTAKALAHQYEDIVVEPHQQLNEAVDAIEVRREQSPSCVAAEDEKINAILDTAHEELHACGVVAAHESADIAADVNKATQQLLFGGYNLGRTYNKCQNYKNSVLKQSCMAKFYVQATIYMVNARSSIKTIKKSTNESIPAVFADSNVCTHSATEQAIFGLNGVNQSIDACEAKTARH